MRVTFLGHACHLVEFGGTTLLTDPWLVDPIFEGLVEHDTPLAFGPADLPPIDALLLTHAHLDHFNAPTLAALPDKSIPVLHPEIGFTRLDSNLRRLGFTNLRACPDWEGVALGGARVTATPSVGIEDECAWWIEGEGGAFWNTADTPQSEALAREIRLRLGPPTLCALGHNSFDMAALLELPSTREADHGPRAGASSAAVVGAPFVFAAGSNMRWRGQEGDAITQKVIRRDARHLRAELDRRAPASMMLDLTAGDAWSREGGIERKALQGSPATTGHDYIDAFLGESLPGPLPSTEETFRRELPKWLASRPAASRQVGQSVCFEIIGEDPGTFTIDFRRPEAPAGEGGTAAFGLRVPDVAWKQLFMRRASWQIVLASGAVAVTHYEPGARPAGLHFVFALQGIFP